MNFNSLYAYPNKNFKLVLAVLCTCVPKVENGVAR